MIRPAVTYSFLVHKIVSVISIALWCSGCISFAVTVSSKDRRLRSVPAPTPDQCSDSDSDSDSSC